MSTPSEPIHEGNRQVKQFYLPCVCPPPLRWLKALQSTSANNNHRLLATSGKLRYYQEILLPPELQRVPRPWVQDNASNLPNKPPVAKPGCYSCRRCRFGVFALAPADVVCRRSKHICQEFNRVSGGPKLDHHRRAQSTRLLPGRR